MERQPNDIYRPPAQLTIPDAVRVLPTTTVGPALKLCYGWLRTLAGDRPAVVEATNAEIGAALGASHRAAAKWLDGLESAGLIEFQPERTKGVRAIYVHNPGNCLHVAKTEPPRPLLDNLPDDPADLCAHKGPDVCAPKGPDLCARKGPSTIPFQTQEPTAHQPLTEKPPDQPADLCAPKGPPRPHGTHETQEYLTPITHGNHETMAHPPAGHTAAGRRDTTDEESLRALVEQRRAEAERAEHSGERPIDAILAAALDRFADRTTTEAQITSWADTIVRIVADAGFHRSIAQRAASAIVCHGLDADVVREILSAVQRKRRERTLEGAGKYFHFRIRSECSKAGVPWPKPKGSHEV